MIPVEAVTDFIAQHPGWADILVFATAAVESILFLGALIPGTTILIGVGVVVGLGHLSLWPILLWAVLGAIAGDGASYLIGRHYRERIGEIWPFSRQPQLLEAGDAFIHRHGGKSILIGRFAPVLRAVVPVTAGVLGMRPSRFFAANIASALAWAPAHILPGAALGVSLVVLGGISRRLVVVVVALLVAVVLGAWLLRFAVLRALPFLARWRAALSARMLRREGRVARSAARLLDPAHPGGGAVLTLGLLFLASAIAFAAIVQDVVERDPLVLADAGLRNLLQSLQTEWANGFMAALGSLGDLVVTALVTGAVLGWLVWRGSGRLAAGLAAGVALAAGSALALQYGLRIAPPDGVTTGAAYSFPSLHVTVAAALYGMMAWLATMRVPARWQWAPLVAAGAFLGAVAVARVYLGLQWPSDVGAGLLIGFGIAATFGLAFYEETESVPPGGYIAVVLAALLVAGTAHGTGMIGDPPAVAGRPVVAAVSIAAWRAGGWAALPAARVDLVGEAEESFLLQWAGTPQSLGARLALAGWTAPVTWSWASAVGFATGTASAATLPALATFHDGLRPVLTFVAPGATADERVVLRAWPSGMTVNAGAEVVPVLLASVVVEPIARPWGMASLPRGAGSAPGARALLRGIDVAPLRDESAPQGLFLGPGG